MDIEAQHLRNGDIIVRDGRRARLTRLFAGFGTIVAVCGFTGDPLVLDSTEIVKLLARPV